MSCFLVLDKNLIDPETVASYSTSSEQSAYPIENAIDLEKRRRVWRSNGYWNVETGENTIVFRETVGVDLTATITVDEYTSDSTFRAAIKSALDAAGDSTYTVSRDSTNRLQITSNGLGGGGIFQLMWTSETDFGDLIGFDTSANDTGALTYTADLVRIHSLEWVKWDFGFPTEPQAFIAVADRNRGMKISPNAVVRLKGNLVDEWTSPLVNLTLTVRDRIMGVIESDGLGTPCRYWRLEILDPDNALGYVEIGSMFFGNSAVITRGAPVFPLQTDDIDFSEVVYSEGGQTISGRRSQTESFQLNWEGLNKASVEELIGVWEYYGTSATFIIAMDTEGAFSTDEFLWTRLVRFNAPPSKILVRPNNWSMTWRLREEL